MTGTQALAERLRGLYLRDAHWRQARLSVSDEAAAILADGSVYLPAYEATRVRVALRVMEGWDCGQPAGKFNNALAVLREALEVTR